MRVSVSPSCKSGYEDPRSRRTCWHASPKQARACSTRSPGYRCCGAPRKRNSIASGKIAWTMGRWDAGYQRVGLYPPEQAFAPSGSTRDQGKKAGPSLMSSSESEPTSHGRHLTGFSTSNGLAAPTNHARATVQKVVSGGQTGVDRAALDVALELGLARGGWCPKGRKAEDGRIPP